MKYCYTVVSISCFLINKLKKKKNLKVVSLRPHNNRSDLWMMLRWNLQLQGDVDPVHHTETLTFWDGHVPGAWGGVVAGTPGLVLCRLMETRQYFWWSDILTDAALSTDWSSIKTPPPSELEGDVKLTNVVVYYLVSHKTYVTVAACRKLGLSPHQNVSLKFRDIICETHIRSVNNFYLFIDFCSLGSPYVPICFRPDQMSIGLTGVM